MLKLWITVMAWQQRLLNQHEQFKRKLAEHPDEGNGSIEFVIIAAIVVSIAVAVGVIITAKVLAKARGIQF